MLIRFSSDFKKKADLKKSYKKNTTRYFSGKHAGTFFKYNWTPLYAGATTNSSSPLTIEVRSNIFKKARYKTDRLPIGFAPVMPALDFSDCAPFDRFHHLRKMKGYGIDKFKYTPYQVPSRQTVRQQFEIYFDRNSSDASSESIQSVIDYLKSNNYSILNATIVGYSSVEGDDQRNIRLQQKRAKVLFNLLQKYNSEPILKDTVIVNSGYEFFRQTIKQTPYQWLDSLSDEKIRETINTNHILLSAIEPFLKPQRKAVLKLVVAKRIEGVEIVEKFKRDFTLLEMQLDPKGGQGLRQAEIEARVMGMIKYLYHLLENDFIKADEAAEIIDNAFNNRMVRVLDVYHQIIQFEKESYKDSLEWSNRFSKYGYTEPFIVAQSNLISLINEANNEKQKNKFRQQLVDIQTYTFDFVLMHWISPATLCEMDYPDHPNFRGYKLNQLAFLHYLSGFEDVPCEELRVIESPMVKKYSDDWLDEIQKSNKNSESTLPTIENGDEETSIEEFGIDIPILFTKSPDGRYYPSFGKEVYSSLLYYLKTLFAKNEGSVTQYMSVSDNLIEFDIYTLVEYHVSEWDPFKNYFADPEVQLLEIDKVINLLKKHNSRICAPQANQLYLDYHLKALHYINLYFEPGNAKQAAIAQQALQYITNYYSKRATKITPRLSIYILHQLNAFHWIPGKYDGTWYAWNLLKSITANRDLSKDEIYLYKKYEMYYVKKQQKL
jgi:hypothetical protein